MGNKRETGKPESKQKTEKTEKKQKTGKTVSKQKSEKPENKQEPVKSEKRQETKKSEKKRDAAKPESKQKIEKTENLQKMGNPENRREPERLGDRRKSERSGDRQEIRRSPWSMLAVVLAVLLCIWICSALIGEGDDWEAPPEVYYEYPTESPTASPVPSPTATAAPEADAVFSVVFLDVGQADSALVGCNGHYMLIDGGNRGDSDLVYTVLKREGISHLDIVVGTHAHEDHIGGLPGAFEYVDADLTLSPVTEYGSKVFTNFAAAAEAKGGGLTVPKAGDTYKLGEATVTILGLNGGKDTNNTSIVLKVEYGEVSFLFVGDAELEAEQALMEAGVDLSATVLKVGHHGSDSSTSYAFLREVMPTYAVISVGMGNDYGHPTGEVLSRLRDENATIYRTDLQGDITFISDGKNIWVTTDRTATKKALMTTGDKKQVKPTATPNEPMVWVTESGKKYHYRADCGSMENPQKLPLSEAEGKGYTPCQKCRSEDGE